MDITCPLCGQPTPTPADILATRATCARCGESFALDVLPTMVPVAAPTPATPAESLAGRRLGGCRLVRVIGRGGMGEVYEAVQESLSRKVAVKVLPPGLAKDEAFIKRFNRESGALAQLSHPHIVAIYDRGCEDGHYYFVLEHVEGPGGGVAETLHSRLRNGPGLAPGDCARLMVQITEALAYAHSKGVIHRDIKPSNILLDARGQARLVDFGIARLVNAGPVEDHQLTLTGEVLGTTGYLAPEQREGRKDVDGRADIYSCGVMLYQMLTGRMPEGVFELPSEVVPGLPPAWDAAVEMALQRNLTRRCQTMAAFLQTLRAVAEGQAIPARPRPSERVLPTPTPAPAPVTPVATRPPDTAAQHTPVVGKCAKCGTVNPGTNRFCAECGVTLYETCPACKAENRVGTKFCGQCGTEPTRHRRREDQRRQALELVTRAGSLPATEAAPLLRQAAGVWNTLLAEAPEDTAGEAARNEARAQLCAALLRQAQELTDQATARPPTAAVPLLRQADGILDELLAEFPECEPARAANQELQRQIPAQLLQQAQELATQAETLPSAQAVPLLRQGAELLKALLTEFPDYEPARIARQELRERIPARLFESPQKELVQAAQATPEAALPLLKQAEAGLKQILTEFPDFVPAREAKTQAVAQLRAVYLERASSRPSGKAVSAYREMLAHFPGDAEATEKLEQELRAQRERAAELIGRGHFSEALAHLSEPLADSPTDGELLALRNQAEEGAKRYLALDEQLGRYLDTRYFQAALRLVDEMQGLCPDSESLAARREQASQAVEAAIRQKEEGERLLRTGRFFKALKSFDSAFDTCADDFKAQDRLFPALAACAMSVLVVIALLGGLARGGYALLDRRAWANTQASAQEAGGDDVRVEQIYSAYLTRSFKNAVATAAANEKVSESLNRQAKVAALLAEAKTRTSMTNAWQGLVSLGSLLELAPNHAEAKQLLAVLQERERERQAKIAELLAEAKANNNLTNALKGMESLNSLFGLDANLAEAKQLLPVLQQRESDRQTKIAELLAEAKTNANPTNALKGMEILKGLFTLDASHAEARQLLVVLAQEEQRRLDRIEELLASATASNNITNAWKGIASLTSLAELEANHAGAKQLLPLLQEQERRRQVRITELFAEAKTTTSMTNAWKGLASLKSLFALDASHPAAKQLLAVLQERESERQAKIAELLTEAETNNSMANARKGMEILKSLFELDANHPEAKQLLGLLQERERDRLTKIAELLAEAKASNNIENAEKGLASLKSLFELDANHAEAKLQLALLQEQERRRQARIAELLAEAKASPATSPKGMESLQAIFKIDANNLEAKRLFVAFQERERERQRQMQVAGLLATAKADFLRKDAKSAVKSLAELLKVDGTHEEGRRLQKDLWRLASKDAPWENSFGMRFVPVPGTKVLFCIWETRLQDYQEFRQPRRKPSTNSQQGPTEPVIASSNEAKAFCAWLTAKERAQGKLLPGQSYQLPTDSEWSAAVGSSRYPWGNQPPIPPGAGNYGSGVFYGNGVFNPDTFLHTSPVGSFKPNQFGLYDLGGNVWEWCAGRDRDSQSDASKLVLRGASYKVTSGVLESAYRETNWPDEWNDNDAGFRVVLVVGDGAR